MSEQDVLHRLESCRSCGSRVVERVGKRKIGLDRHQLLLHCPNCDRRTSHTVSSRILETYEAELRRIRGTLLHQADCLNRESRTDLMREFGEAFVRALKAGAIWPSDFGSPEL